MKEITQLPILESNRLIIRPISLQDCSDMFDYAQRDNVGPRAGWTPHKSIEDTKMIIMKMLEETLTEDNIGNFALVLKANQKMIGTLGLHKLNRKNSTVTMGYVLNPDYWGQGIMPEAVQEVITWVFNILDIYRIEICHFDFNQQSKRVILKCGFTFEGIKRKAHLLDSGKRCDIYVYSILKEEFDNKLLPWQ